MDYLIHLARNKAALTILSTALFMGGHVQMSHAQAPDASPSAQRPPSPAPRVVDLSQQRPAAAPKSSRARFIRLHSRTVEGQANHYVGITLNQPAPTPLAVPYFITEDSTATPGLDYVLLADEPETGGMPLDSIQLGTDWSWNDGVAVNKGNGQSTVRIPLPESDCTLRFSYRMAYTPKETRLPSPTETSIQLNTTGYEISFGIGGNGDNLPSETTRTVYRDSGSWHDVVLRCHGGQATIQHGPRGASGQMEILFERKDISPGTRRQFIFIAGPRTEIRVISLGTSDPQSATTAGVLHFQKGERTRYIGINPCQDSEEETAERLTIAFQPDADLELMEPVTHTVVLLDHDVVARHYPDVAVVDISAAENNGKLKAGARAEFNATVTNHGSVSTLDGGWNVALFLSRFPYASDNKKELAALMGPTLAPGETKSVHFTVDSMPDVSPGNYFFLLVADSDNDMIETDERNSLAMPFTLLDPVFSK